MGATVCNTKKHALSVDDIRGVCPNGITLVQAEPQKGFYLVEDRADPYTRPQWWVRCTDPTAISRIMAV